MVVVADSVVYKAHGALENSLGEAIPSFECTARVLAPTVLLLTFTIGDMAAN